MAAVTESKLCSACSAIFANNSYEHFLAQETERHNKNGLLISHLSKGMILLKDVSSGRSTTYDLDKVLGNHFGRFDMSGQNFSHSAANIRIQGSGKNVLFANLHDPVRQSWPEARIYLGAQANAGAANIQLYVNHVPPGARQHHASRASWLQAVSDGCSMCSTIEETKLPLSLTWYHFERQERAPDPDLLCTLWLCSDTSAPHDKEFEIRKKPLERERHDLQAAAESARKSNNTGSSESLSLASVWMETCLSSHARCSKARTPSWYPKRLVHLSESSIKLITTAEHDAPGPYATLSYCWGKIVPNLMLTSDTLELLRGGVPISCMNATFRDAFVTARFLGINYMWFDLCCILQGEDDASKSDWQEQAGLMHKVYQNALVNIGAAHGEHSDSGCFSRRQPAHSLQHVVCWRPDSTGDNPRLYDVQHIPYVFENFNEHLYNQALFTRGWVVQERILAPRMLLFGKGCMFWECGSLRTPASEWFPNATNRMHGAYPSPTAGKFTSRFRDDQEANQYLTPWTFYGPWSTVLTTYTGTCLSFPDKDKMMAIAGMCNRIAELDNDVYHNGFFARQLPRALCWRPQSRSNFSRPVEFTQLRAPSWHWASSDNQLEMPMWFGLHKALRSVPLIFLFPGCGPYAATLTSRTPLISLGKAIPVIGREKNRFRFRPNLPDVNYISDWTDPNGIGEDLFVLPIQFSWIAVPNFANAFKKALTGMRAIQRGKHQLRDGSQSDRSVFEVGIVVLAGSHSDGALYRVGSDTLRREADVFHLFQAMRVTPTKTLFIQ